MSEQLAQELAANLRTSKTQLNDVNEQLLMLKDQEKLAHATTKELESYPMNKVWRGLGKAFILQDKSQYVKDLVYDVGIVEEQTKALKIKQHYLETTIEKIIENLRALMEKA